METTGKTLNMNMLYCFFSNQYAGRGEMFEGLAVWEEENYRRLQGTCPVVFLTFADVKAPTFEGAVAVIKQNITEKVLMLSGVCCLPAGI